jgi:hypothetical protein
MKKNSQVFFTLFSLIITTQAAALNHTANDEMFDSGLEILKTHNTISSVSLRLHLNDNLHGFVDSKLCSFCKKIRITITPNTAAYENNIKVPLQQAINRIGRSATITYELKTNKVSSIRW